MIWGKEIEGEYLCPQYRRSVIRERETGEWTSTFVIQGESPYNLTMVNRPKRFVINELGQISLEYDEKNSFNIRSPSKGYVISYDSFTGWPSKTGDRGAAMEALGELNYFEIPEKINNISVVARFFYSPGKGAFCVCVGLNPASYDGNIGVRSCRRAA